MKDSNKPKVHLSAKQWLEVQERIQGLSIPSDYLNRIPSFVNEISGKKKKAPQTHTIEAAMNFSAYLAPYAFAGIQKDKEVEQLIHLFSQLILILNNFTLDRQQVGRNSLKLV